MKQKIIFIILVITGLCFLTQNVSLAQDTQNFSIENFSAYYDLSKNDQGVGTLHVDEYIWANFPNYNQNHGILRALPQKYNNANLHLKINNIDKSAEKNSSNIANWNYTTSSQNGNLVLKIGDANVYVKGSQNYHISYNMENVINDYQELYWNVNGTQWQQTITNTKALINLDEGIADNLIGYKCYAGKYGDTSANCNTSKQKNNGQTQIIVSATKPILAGETLTYVLKFKVGTFTVIKPSFFEKYGLLLSSILGATIPPLTALVYMFIKWRRYGRDPKGRGTIIAQYEPPKNTSLLINDYVLNEKARPIAISAQILNLATRGFIRIVDNSKDRLLGKKKDFALEITKEPGSLLTNEELSAMTMFFDTSLKNGSIVNLNDLKQKLSSKVTNLSSALTTTATNDGYFTKDPSKVINHYRLLATAILILGGIALFVLSFIIPLGIGLIIAGLILIIGAKAMPAKTLKGVELHDYMLGLKLYIGMAEQERIRFHDSPDTAQRQRININDQRQMVKIFESLLPYAMLFGMEKQWGKQFEKLYEQAPDWYAGNWTAFNTGYIISSLSDFNSASAITFASPGSSNSSGFSGGFSGGGGGGGGGGGW